MNICNFGMNTPDFIDEHAFLGKYFPDDPDAFGVKIQI